ASGRLRVDLDECLDALGAEMGPAPAAEDPAEDPAPTGTAPASAAAHPGHPATGAVLEAVRRAPSGGNVQPWRVEVGRAEIRLQLDRERTTTMDVEHRGSYVALGAALFNARAAASAAGALGPHTLFPDPAAPDLVTILSLGRGSEPRLTAAGARVLDRTTNRAVGRRHRSPAPPWARTPGTAWRRAPRSPW
ncbi:MAG: hypothetical protein K0S40_4904, partial [Actinomycetospora sp.]|nr:hypothetical protein [Actinomycetospora sp.]